MQDIVISGRVLTPMRRAAVSQYAYGAERVEGTAQAYLIAWDAVVSDPDADRDLLDATRKEWEEASEFTEQAFKLIGTLGPLGAHDDEPVTIPAALAPIAATALADAEEDVRSTLVEEVTQLSAVELQSAADLIYHLDATYRRMPVKPLRLGA